MAEHYTKEDVVKNDFLFISYKHDDSEIVKDTLDFLFEQGIRLWYDTDLVVGERWPEIAEKLIKHENCKGVVFFNSENSFKSEPVYMERTFAIERAKTCKEKGQPFVVFPVNIGKPSTALLIKSIFDSLPEDDREIEKTFPLKYLQTICTIFSSDMIYCYADRNSANEYKTRLAENIKKALPTVVDASSLNARALEKNLGKAQSVLTAGKCKGKAVELPSFLLAKNQRVEYQGNWYIVEDGVGYEMQSASWLPISCEDDNLVFLAQNLVDVRNGGEELNVWLKEVFVKMAFTEDEQKHILDVRLLSEEEVGKIEDPAMLICNGSESHWWLGSLRMGALQKVVKKDGSIYQSGYNYRMKKSGVRPVICVKKDFLTSVNK